MAKQYVSHQLLLHVILHLVCVHYGDTSSVDYLFHLAAGPEADFTAVAAVLLTFSGGELRQCVNIPIEDDSALEDPEEDFSITITAPPGPSIIVPTPTVPVIIVDDDSEWWRQLPPL